MWDTRGLRAATVYQPVQKHFSILTSGTDASVHTSFTSHLTWVRHVMYIRQLKNNEKSEMAVGCITSNLG